MEDLVSRLKEAGDYILGDVEREYEDFPAKVEDEETDEEADPLDESAVLAAHLQSARKRLQEQSEDLEKSKSLNVLRREYCNLLRQMSQVTYMFDEKIKNQKSETEKLEYLSTVFEMLSKDGAKTPVGMSRNAAKKMYNLYNTDKDVQEFFKYVTVHQNKIIDNMNKNSREMGDCYREYFNFRRIVEEIGDNLIKLNEEMDENRRLSREYAMSLTNMRNYQIRQQKAREEKLKLNERAAQQLAIEQTPEEFLEEQLSS